MKLEASHISVIEFQVKFVQDEGIFLKNLIHKNGALQNAPVKQLPHAHTSATAT